MKRVVGIDPTGSSFDRIAACPASAALPQVHDGYPNDFRERGTAIHAYIDRIAQLRREGFPLDQACVDALAEVDEQWRAACEQVDVEALGHRTTLSTEVSLAYDWKADTGRVLTPVAPRQYEIDPDREVALTLDVAGVGARHVAVADFKGPYAWLPEPSRSLQLGVGALTLARIHRARSASLEYLRVRSDGSVSRWAAELDVFGIETVAERVQTMMRDVEQIRVDIYNGEVIPNVTEGPWCTYCKARNTCPAKVQLVRSVLAGEGAKKLSLREPITPENVGHVYALVKRTKEGIRIAEKALHAYERDGAPSTPEQLGPSAIPVGEEPDGSRRFYGRFERPGNEKLDGKVVYTVLAEKFGPEAAAKACSMEASKDSIRDVVREHKAKDETIKEVEEGVLAAVRARGGAARPPTDKAAEFVIGPEGTMKKASRKKAS